MAWLVVAAWLGAAQAAQPGDADLQAWRSWKDIAPAVVVAPLDGPEEVLEKAEIIADRRDALGREQARVAVHCEGLRATVNGVDQQLAATRDMLDVRGGRDLLLRRRARDLRSRQRALRTLTASCEANLEALGAALVEVAARHDAYLRRAQALRAEETGTPSAEEGTTP